MSQPRDRISPSFAFGRRGQGGNQPASRVSSPPSRPAKPAEPQPAATASPPAPAGGFPQWVGSPRATLAIVFTDIVGSAALTGRIGNRAMDALRRAHFDRARQLVVSCGGYLVKTMGDSVMAAFRAASDALDFALAIHRDPGDAALAVRAGLHVGPVTVEGEDAHGSTVNFAARVVGVPAGAEVFLSSDAKCHVDQEGAAAHAELTWRAHGDIELKGFPGKHILWSVATR